MESFDFQKTNRKAWTLLKKLSAGERTATRKKEAEDPNKIARRIIQSAKGENTNKEPRR